jgi:hypothetical protein
MPEDIQRKKYLNDFYLLKTSKLYLLRNIVVHQLTFTNSVQISELNVDFGRPVIWPHKSRSIHRTYLKLLNVYSKGQPGPTNAYLYSISRSPLTLLTQVIRIRRMFGRKILCITIGSLRKNA